MKVEHTFAVVTLDWKHFREHRLQPEVFPLGGGDLRLQKVNVGIGLQFDQVGRSDDLFDLAEVYPFSNSR